MVQRSPVELSTLMKMLYTWAAPTVAMATRGYRVFEMWPV